MPTVPHVEKHFTATETVRDVVIGMADGLTVPFALAAGLAAAVSSTKIIVTAGLAEIVAGAIAMGLGGYLTARTDAEHYGSERARENWKIFCHINRSGNVDSEIGCSWGASLKRAKWHGRECNKKPRRSND